MTDPLPNPAAPAKTKGVRQERMRQRRRYLSEVVMQMIQQRGFDAISVNEVAQRASMSIGGLYRHINTKNDLLEMVCDEINLNLLEEMTEAASVEKGVSNKLSAAVRTYWQRHWDSSNAVLVAYREYQSFSEEAKARYTTQERRIADFFGDLIRAGIVLEEFRAVDEKLLASEIILLSHMRALKGYVFKGKDRAVVFEDHLELIFSRLRTTIPA
jgi:AcrR family transcriptional regulator